MLPYIIAAQEKTDEEKEKELELAQNKKVSHISIHGCIIICR